MALAAGLAGSDLGPLPSPTGRRAAEKHELCKYCIVLTQQLRRHLTQDLKAILGICE